jgi:hypothetical protein
MWLSEELASWTEQIASGNSADRDAATQAIASWKRDSELAGVREADGLAQLPEPERKVWQALWTNVDHRLAAKAKSPADP